MKPARKKVSFTNLMGQAETSLRDTLIGGPKRWLKQAREKMRDLPKANFDLGCLFAERGKWMDAIFRFRVTIYLQPAYPNVWYNLGCCYFRLGQQAKARAALLKALEQEPANEGTIYMLATVDGTALKANQRPRRMPKSMLIDFFSSVAEDYDLAEAQGKYQAGRVVHEAMKPLVTAAAPTIIDLGCGTGIVSRPWRAAAASIQGVDITPAMLAQAGRATHADKKLFDVVTEADITALPESMPADTADLVLIVNVVSTIGDLGSVLAGAARVTKPGGHVAITVDILGAGKGYSIIPGAGRFGHTAAYVKEAAALHKLAPVKEAKVELYPETPSLLLVFSKGA
jgi:predicted TPR repeat methyltransferase